MIIGITGSIGSGKTTAAKIFSKYHFKIIDADKIGHELLEKTQIKNKLIRNFDKGIINKNKKTDRKILGNIVFNDDKKLKKLNSIIHPYIIKEIKNRIKEVKKECGNKTRIIIDAPLLLETGADKLVDKVIVVKALHENVIERNKKFTIDQLENISLKQMGLDEKLKKADFVIDNTKGIKHLEKQIKKTINKI